MTMSLSMAKATFKWSATVAELVAETHKQYRLAGHKTSKKRKNKRTVSTRWHWLRWTSSTETVTTVAMKVAKKSIVGQSILRNVLVETSESSATSAAEWAAKKVTVGTNIHENDPVGWKKDCA